MGEAKRRKDFGEVTPSAQPWWNKQKAQQFMDISSRGAWIGIGGMVVYWVVIRFVGPALGWWQLQD